MDKAGLLEILRAEPALFVSMIEYIDKILPLIEYFFQLGTNSSVGIVSNAGVNSAFELTPMLELTLLWS